MSEPWKPAVIVDSLRKESLNLMLSKALIECALKVWNLPVSKLATFLCIMPMLTVARQKRGPSFARL